MWAHLGLGLAADLNDVLLPDLVPVRKEGDHSVGRDPESLAACEVEVDQAVKGEGSQCSRIRAREGGGDGQLGRVDSRRTR